MQLNHPLIIEWFVKIKDNNSSLNGMKTAYYCSPSINEVKLNCLIDFDASVINSR